MTLRARGVVVAVSLGAAACGELQTAELVRGSQCGPSLDFVPVNQYQGELAGIQDREDAVVLINGNCTGTLIAAIAGPVVLTAGHCVGLGDQALLAFNIEAEPDGDPLVTNGTVIEQSDIPDYALIQLDALPVATPTVLTRRSSDVLAVIQHPLGRPKVIAEGRLSSECSGVLFYTELDTLVGSSGAGVLNRAGELVAVHTDGDCADDGSGTNLGWTAARIVDVSPYLQPVDLGER